MRMITGMTALVLVCVFSGSGDVQALSLENMATVVQVNACQDCGGVEQQNLAFIFQEIGTNDIFMYIPDRMTSNEAFMKKISSKDADMAERLMNLNSSQTFLMWSFSVSEDGDVQALSLENMATVVQVNACRDCGGAEQQNLAFIFQEIETNDIFMYIPDRMISNETFLTKIANIASVIQGNICIECAKVKQQSFVTIFQEIDIDNFLDNSRVYQEYLDIPQNEISNITNIAQINECIICQNVDQINSVFILQTIDSEDLFIPTSDAEDSLFSDLVNMAMMMYGRTAESRVQDGEGTSRNGTRYFVPVRPGVHAPTQNTGPR